MHNFFLEMSLLKANREKMQCYDVGNVSCRVLVLIEVASVVSVLYSYMVYFK